MTRYRALVVDDEWNMRNLLRIYLSKNGFEVQEAQNGKEAIAMVECAQSDFDIILLDLMMPEMDGWQVCKRIRETRMTPILMLTARTDTKDKVAGFSLGADDYVVKPFEPEELIARVQALVRRASFRAGTKASPSRKLEVKELLIYPEGRRVTVCGTAVEFTHKEFDILLLLAENPHRAYPRELIVELLWGHDYAGESRVVDTHMKNIREKVQKAGLSFNPIRTVWGVGYQFADLNESL
jgi:two-component system, OmpR family, response regulator ResD